MSGARTWTIIERDDELVLALNGDGNDAARIPRSELNALCAHLISVQLRQPALDFGTSRPPIGEDCED